MTDRELLELAAKAAVGRLQEAVAECKALGVAVTIQFQECERM